MIDRVEMGQLTRGTITRSSISDGHGISTSAPVLHIPSADPGQVSTTHERPPGMRRTAFGRPTLVPVRGPLGRSPRVSDGQALEQHDGGELLGLQAGAAHERTVDVRL